MTSATTHSASGTGRRAGEGHGLIVFASPFWSLTIIAIDVVALWGLCAYGSRQNVTA
jgi:hypothetical protein